MVPIVELPPAIPLTCHVTDSSVVFATVAVNDCVSPVLMFAVIGQIATRIEAVEAEHEVTVAFVGALDVEDAGLSTTLAVSCRPASSVTVICAVP